MAKIEFFFFSEAHLLQNTLQKEMVLEEKDGVLSRKSLQESLQNSVNPFLSHLSTRSDEWEGFSASLLIARA